MEIITELLNKGYTAKEIDTKINEAIMRIEMQRIKYKNQEKEKEA